MNTASTSAALAQTPSATDQPSSLHSASQEIEDIPRAAMGNRSTPAQQAELRALTKESFQAVLLVQNGPVPTPAHTPRADNPDNQPLTGGSQSSRFRTMNFGFLSPDLYKPCIQNTEGERDDRRTDRSKRSERHDRQDRNSVPGSHSSIAHLKRGADPHDDSKQRIVLRPPPMEINGELEWEVEKLLAKRRKRRGRGWSIEYLVSWLGYSAEDDSWVNIKDMTNARELIEEFDSVDFERFADHT